MATIEITNRDEVRAGDLVTYGSLGYHHTGIARDVDGDGEPLEDGALQVDHGGTWYPDFISAIRNPWDAPDAMNEGTHIALDHSTGLATYCACGEAIAGATAEEALDAWIAHTH